MDEVSRYACSIDVSMDEKYYFNDDKGVLQSADNLIVFDSRIHTNFWRILLHFLKDEGLIMIIGLFQTLPFITFFKKTHVSYPRGKKIKEFTYPRRIGTTVFPAGTCNSKVALITSRGLRRLDVHASFGIRVSFSLGFFVTGNDRQSCFQCLTMRPFLLGKGSLKLPW